VAELSPTTVRVIGGLATDDLADEVVEVVSSIYGDLIIEDLQVVDESFAATTDITLRLSAPDLFAYNRDDLNPTYFPLIDQLAAAAVEAGSWQIEVSGHTDDTGPAEGNQRLSEGRALSAARRLIDQGVPSGQVTSVGRGEDQPVATNDTEAGRLANRRVEFVVTR
jgi:outer membrane protein OmpA-like peptidoglycan-associated protein